MTQTLSCFFLEAGSGHETSVCAAQFYATPIPIMASRSGIKDGFGQLSEALKTISLNLMHEWRERRFNQALATYPATSLLCSISSVTFIAIQANYLIQLLSWIMYYLDIVARVMFGWLYPAALIAITVVWFMHIFSINTARFNIMPRYPIITKFMRVALCISAGQLILECLPRVVSFFMVPFASAPTLLLTIIFSMGVIGYGLYLLLLPDALLRQGRVARNNNLDTDTVDANLCVVCLVNPKTHLIKPCNHFCVCADCIRQLNDCPLCKRPINIYERIYST